MEQEKSLTNKRYQLIDLLNTFSENTITGLIRGYWKAVYVFQGLKSQPDKKIAIQLKNFINHYLITYYNTGVKNMVTEGEDTYFIEEFSKMKNVLDHGYRCLLNMSIMITVSMLARLDISELKFDYSKLDFVNLKEKFNAICKENRDKLASELHDSCGYKGEDITKWNPDEPMFFGIPADKMN